jgi:hypothetical protein
MEQSISQLVVDDDEVEDPAIVNSSRSYRIPKVKIKRELQISEITQMYLLHYVIKFVRLAAGPWFSPGTTVSSINKTDCHDITEILLKVTLSIIKLTNQCTKGPDLIYNYLCNQCLSPLTNQFY